MDSGETEPHKNMFEISLGVVETLVSASDKQEIAAIIFLLYSSTVPVL
jgi:hypothetical protein